MMSSTQSNIILNEDEKEIFDKHIQLMQRELSAFHYFYNKNMLDKDMNANLIGLLDNHLSKIRKATKYDGPSETMKDFNDGMIKRLNLKVEELEKQIESNHDIPKVKQQLVWISKVIRAWWDYEGYYFIKDLQFDSSGNINLKFGFNIQNSVMIDFADNPATMRKNIQDKIKSLKEEGIVFIPNDEDKDLVDCDINRKYFIRLIKDNLPSVIIKQIHNHLNYHNQDYFTLNYIEVIIKDFNDIVELNNKYNLVNKKE